MFIISVLISHIFIMLLICSIFQTLMWCSTYPYSTIGMYSLHIVDNLVGWSLIQFSYLIIYCGMLVMLLYLDLILVLTYYIFHQVNYQNTRDTKFRLFKPWQKPLPLGEENPKKFFLYIFHSRVPRPWPLAYLVPPRPRHWLPSSLIF